MAKDGDGWDSRFIKETWADTRLRLDDYNECVNFYFSIERDSEACAACGGSGYHPDALWVADSFYGHSSPFTTPTHRDRALSAVLADRIGLQPHPETHGRGTYPSDEVLARYCDAFRSFCEAMRDGDGFWKDKITEDEAAALVEAGRGAIDQLVTAEDFNRANRPGARSLGHDAINRHILIKARCARFGIPTTCPACDGHGSIFTAPDARLALTLWILHPRKGCSRGVEVRSIRQDEVPAVRAWLAEAAARNAARFVKVAPQTVA